MKKNGSHNFEITIQPSDKHATSACYALMKFHPSAAYRMNIQEFPSGCIIRWSSTNDDNLGFNLPIAIQEFADQPYFCTSNSSLNEFGILYYGLFILGNYVRYFPDQWMVDVEHSTPLALAARVFSDIAQERAPLLSLSELSQHWYIRE